MSNSEYLDLDALASYVHEHVVRKFYRNRTERLNNLSLEALLLRKNPYLFRTKNISLPWEYITSAFEAYLSSQEETMFGDLMEHLAIHISNLVYGGEKAEARVYPSLDLIFQRDGKYYIVGIKSGTNWGNADQIARMKSNFKAAKQRLRANGITQQIIAINGCMYGRDNNPFKADGVDPDRDYYKLCGQEFWDLISGDPELYVRLIEPLEEEARMRGPEFKSLYDRKVTEMTLQFSQRFLIENAIDWEKLIKHVSEKQIRRNRR